jgi:hypothetical protein
MGVGDTLMGKIARNSIFPSNRVTKAWSKIARKSRPLKIDGKAE